MKKYLTREGLEKLKKELEYLKGVKRKEIAKRLKHAASFGDLSENAAYRETKEDQAFLEGKILELENLIRNTVVIQKKEKPTKVQIGSTVWLKTGKEEKKFQIVGPEEANPLEGKISYDSPLGKTLLDKKKGAIVELETPEGKIKYKILKIE